MDKVIFITGTSSGLGKTTAKHFAAMGWKVAATMRNPSKETELTQSNNISVFKMDVTDLLLVKKAVAEVITMNYSHVNDSPIGTAHDTADVIFNLATGESNLFRTVIGADSLSLMELRNT